MKKFLNKIWAFSILIVAFGLFTNPSLASSPQTNSSFLVLKGDSTWVLQAELKDVKAFYRITQCGNEQVVLLKFVNSGNSSVIVTWDDQMQFTGETIPRKTKLTTSSLIVSPGEISLLSCSDSSVPVLISKPFDDPIVNIESFSFLNISVTSK